MSIDNNIDRELRRLKNYSQPSINVDGLSNRNLSEGDLKFTKDKTNLILNKKHKGLLWQSKFYKDGNQIVDKNLTVNGNLDVKGNSLKVDGILNVDGSIDLDGNFDINGTLSASQIVEHTGNTGTKIAFATNTVSFFSAHPNAGGVASLQVNSEGVIINNNGEEDTDFRVESNTIDSALKVDSGTDTLSSDCVIIKLPNLPTSDPNNAGQLWNSSGTLKISAG
tara:strand:+ start:154 stop:822 length:669 start_codon:yes stop_codon:yes gene_type:complete